MDNSLSIDPILVGEASDTHQKHIDTTKMGGSLHRHIDRNLVFSYFEMILHYRLLAVSSSIVHVAFIRNLAQDQVLKVS